MSPIESTQRKWTTVANDVTIPEVNKQLPGAVNGALVIPRDAFDKLDRERARLIIRLHEVLVSPELTRECAERNNTDDIGIIQNRLLMALNELIESLPATANGGVYTLTVEVPTKDPQNTQRQRISGTRDNPSALDYTQICPILDTEY